MEIATAKPATQTPPTTPERIMQIGLGFWASKTLLSAVTLGLFTELSKKPMKGSEIQQKFDLHERSLYDFLDTLVTLGFLQREGGIREKAIYSNTPDTDLFLDKNKLSYIGGILEMSNTRLYKWWNDLDEGLRTGLPQNEIKHNGQSLFEAVYADSEILRQFISAMSGLQMGAFIALANKFDFSNYLTFTDLGGASGLLAVQVALNNPNMLCTSFDLPQVEPVAGETIARFPVGDRVRVQSGDFFKDSIPESDVFAYGNILHDWNLEDRKKLIRRAYEALRPGGALVVIENMIDDERRANAFGLMMSLNMLIETDGGANFSFTDFNGWAAEAGFKKFEAMHLVGPTFAAIAYK